MAPTAMIDEAPRDYKNSGLVGDDGSEWIDFEVIIGVMSPK